ncbi:MAG: hypothetical protein Kow0029_01660 [Candidatus Rifleibacteriota bacterium]
MNVKKVIGLILIVLAGLVTGCGLNPSDSGAISNPVFQNEPTASLNVVLSPETVASLRAATTIYTVKIVLLIANPGNITTPYEKMVKVIEISNNSVSASFSSLPARPIIVQVLMDNASVSGNRSFHAAMDLVADQVNTITPVAIGSGDRTDLLAKVALEFYNNPILMGVASNNLTAAIDSATTGKTDFNDMLAAAIAAVPPTGLVILGVDPTTTTNLKVGTTTKTASEIWAAGELWTSTPANMQVKNILRQGFGGYGLVHWQHSRENDNGISKINAADGGKLVYCRNYGALTHFFTLKDGSILAAGYNNFKNAPVVFRWAPTVNGSTYSTSGLSDSGLKWSNYLTELGTDLSGYSIELIATDYDSLVYVIVKKPDNTKVEYRINLDTGARVFVPGDPEEGKIKILAYHTQLQAILENNSISDATRTSQFMAYVADDFKDIAGNPDKKPELESMTLSRLQRYTINSYTFNPETVTIVDSNTIQVVTTMTIDVTRKPGATGSVSAAYIKVIPAPTITWKRYGTEWKIYQGLPYKQEEIGI